MRLEGKTAVVTGAARGLGKGIAVKMAQEGATVAVVDMSEEQASKTAEEIRDAGGHAEAFTADVSDRLGVAELYKEVSKKFGTIDIVVNNAGINRDAMLHKMTNEQWEQVIAVNLTGTFYMMQEASGIMREQGSGSIINISSASWQGNIGQSNYAASKAGVIGLTKTAARELARKHVTCNAICPGFIETDMTRGVPEKVWDIMLGKIPMGYAGKPSDVANMAAFLASDEAAYITGEVINVGGGLVL